MRLGFVSVAMLVALTAWLALSPGARADVTDLSNGVFIVHHEPEIQYSDDPPGGDWCRYYTDSYAIHACDEQNPRIDSAPGEIAVWYILSAWEEEKEFCGVQFCFADYDEDLFTFLNWGSCCPSTGCLEIPTMGWPGPNEGTAMARLDLPWAGNFLPVYWFAGYAYGTGVLPLGMVPWPQYTGWANCIPQIPGEFTATCVGGLGVNTEGHECCGGATPAEIQTWGSLKQMFR